MKQQYDFDRKAAKISALFSNKKYLHYFLITWTSISI